MYKVTTYLNENRFPYLVKEECHYGLDNEARYNSPEEVWELCKAMRMPERATEMCLLLVFSSAGHLICISELSTGSANRSIVSAGEIAKICLLSGGTCCILAHNHPSGVAEPSEPDLLTTERVRKALKMLDIDLLDHMVIGRNEYTSMIEGR